MSAQPTISRPSWRPPLVAALALVGSWMLFVTAAHGQGDDMSRAREAFARGQELFDNGDYETARVAFQESLDAFPHYRTIFNIALCEEKLGRVAEAVEMYQRYVDWPADVPNREEVAKKVEELRQLLPPEPEAPPEPPGGTGEPEPETEPDPAPEEPGEEPGPDLIVPGWITVGIGAAGMITGGVLLGLAQARANEVQNVEGEEYVPKVHDAMQDEGRTFERAGWTVGAIGAAAVAAGVTMLLVSDRAEEQPAEPEIAAGVGPLDGGVALGARWSF